MHSAIENALNDFAATLTFEMESGDDSFDYEYGSIRGTEGGKYCTVYCGDNNIPLTVTATEDDEIDADLVGTTGTLKIKCDSGFGTTVVAVEFIYTIKSVDTAARTAEIEVCYCGNEDYENDSYDYDDYDCDDRYCY